MCAKTGLERKIHQDIQTEILNLDYSRISRESGWKPHSYCILAEYCFSPIKWMKKEHPFVVKLRCSKS